MRRGVCTRSPMIPEATVMHADSTSMNLVLTVWMACGSREGGAPCGQANVERAGDHLCGRSGCPARRGPPGCMRAPPAVGQACMASHNAIDALFMLS